MVCQHFFFILYWEKIRTFPIMLFYKHSWGKHPRAELFAQLPNYILRKKMPGSRIAEWSFCTFSKVVDPLKNLPTLPSPSNLRKHPFPTPSLTLGFIKCFNPSVQIFSKARHSSALSWPPAWLARSPGMGTKWPDRAKRAGHMKHHLPLAFLFQGRKWKGPGESSIFVPTGGWRNWGKEGAKGVTGFLLHTPRWEALCFPPPPRPPPSQTTSASERPGRKGKTNTRAEGESLDLQVRRAVRSHQGPPFQLQTAVFDISMWPGGGE